MRVHPERGTHLDRSVHDRRVLPAFGPGVLVAQRVVMCLQRAARRLALRQLRHRLLHEGLRQRAVDTLETGVQELQDNGAHAHDDDVTLQRELC